MRRRVKTFAAGLVLVFGATSASLVAGTGTAAAAEPIVIGSCVATIQGVPGQPLALSPSAVLDPVLSVVRGVPLLGPGLANGVGGAVSSMGDIPLGAVPSSDTTISGSTIANAAVPRIKTAIQKIPLIGPVLGGIVSGVQGALTQGCAVVVKVINTAGAPVQDAVDTTGKTIQEGAAKFVPPPGDPAPPRPEQPGKPGTNPGGGGAPGPGGNPGGGGGGGALPGPNQNVIGGIPSGGLPLYGRDFDFGRSPMADYSSLPFAKPGLFSPSPATRYGGAVPGYAPQFGILGGEGDANGVQAAGRADTLGPVEGDRIALPVLLAVLALSGATAALVRTWVLRRIAA
ncbi:MAG: hypothetical protein M3548_11690 [Actinomycetota bacterium]|nr:hypothetical protein [Actinomycetota bacterium]